MFKHGRTLILWAALVCLMTGLVPALAEPNPTIGSVVITYHEAINVRAEPDGTSQKVHLVAPGAILPCYGIAPNGWYQIMTPEYVMGYISPKLAQFDPSTASLPLPLTVPRAEAPRPGFMGYMQSDPAITVPQYLPTHQVGEVTGGYVVYSGPGQNYVRQNEGKARVGETTVRVYGCEGPRGEWLLIGYGLTDGGYRLGYVDYRHAVGIRFPVQFIANMRVRLPKDTWLTDDPIVMMPETLLLPAGTVVTVLAYFRSNSGEYVMVEYVQPDGLPMRGFVRRADIPFAQE